MSSRARFQGRGLPTGSKQTSASKTSTGSGSKRITGNTPSGGQQSATKSVNRQVIYNGKIVTPQSLVSRSDLPKPSGKKKPDFMAVPTIDETANNEVNDKEKYSNKFRSRRLSTQLKTLDLTNTSSSKKKDQVDTDEDLLTIQLSESDTNIVFSLTSFIASSDTREIKDIEENNSKYELLVEKHKQSSDIYLSNPSQTMNHSLKNQNDMTSLNSSVNFECQANAYMIIDSMKEVTTSATSTSTDTEIDDELGFATSIKKFITDSVNVSLATPGCLLDPTDLKKPVKEAKKPVEKAENKSRKSMASKLISETSTNPIDEPSTADVSVNHSSERVSENTNSQSNVDKYVDTKDKEKEKEKEVIEKDSTEILFENEVIAILSNPSLLKKLEMMERAVQQNAYHRRHLLYRDLPIIDDENNKNSNNKSNDVNNDKIDSRRNNENLDGNVHELDTERSLNSNLNSTNNQSNNSANNSSTSNVQVLFRYYNKELIQNRAVTAMAWHAINADLLAVGYGKIDRFKDINESIDTGGLILFWSLRNPDYPEKILRTVHSVTSLEFSRLSPLILAVGFINGDVYIYDTKRDNDNEWGKPLYSSTNIHGGGHTDPVWQVKWVTKGIERIESLVSISTDGLIIEWNLKKGLSMNVIMSLKRSNNISSNITNNVTGNPSASIVEESNGWISRSASGFCFDFLPNDISSQIYIVGTEDGSLHKCSTSYSEQYLDTFTGHYGPIYRSKFSLKWPQIFLTCSADWSIKLYHIQSRAPLISMKTTGEDYSITDISWCPGNSTIFAAVTANGKLEIWDLSISSIDPIVLIDTDIDLSKYISDDLLNNPIDEKVNNELVDDLLDKPIDKPLDKLINKSNDKATDKLAESPVNKLVYNLLNNLPKRELTSVLFGEKSPILAAGDNQGNVLIYRVLDPVIITHEGPLQQTMKLKEAIYKQIDPINAQRLASYEQITTNDVMNEKSN